MKDKRIKKIPYGLADYDRLIKKNCYYVDKTRYLGEIENAGDYLWKPLLDYITGLMQESMGLRDLVTGEKSIQAFLNVYLGLSELYIIHS